ncbi:MAG TPA: hypothetical protein VND15_02615 [Candidatus Acidoferrales bacterium]|nr:hypothetical protein [Candidatus Acidoferrales bacterium]
MRKQDTYKIAMMAVLLSSFTLGMAFAAPGGDGGGGGGTSGSLSQSTHLTSISRTATVLHVTETLHQAVNVTGFEVVLYVQTGSSIKVFQNYTNSAGVATFAVPGSTKGTSTVHAIVAATPYRSATATIAHFTHS